jgi:hypothetical protein
MYHPKTAMLPSLLLVLMGSIDCVTTVIGTLYYGASEMNPVLSGVVSNVPLFMALKLSATLCIAGTYVLSTKILNSTKDKSTRSFRVGSAAIKVIYLGLVAFLVVVVVNNFIVLLA